MLRIRISSTPTSISSCCFIPKIRSSCLCHSLVNFQRLKEFLHIVDAGATSPEETILSVPPCRYKIINHGLYPASMRKTDVHLAQAKAYNHMLTSPSSPWFHQLWIGAGSSACPRLRTEPSRVPVMRHESEITKTYTQEATQSPRPLTAPLGLGSGCVTHFVAKWVY